MSDPLFLSGASVPDYLKGVELMTAGMEWQSMNGPVTITLEHIADAIKAANEDPHIQPPRIKLGHTSAVNGDHPDHDPFAAIGDAEPAFGQFVNLRAANDGAVLVGDADNVVAWLAESAPATYPNRSAEAAWQVAAANFDVQTAGGRRYSMVVTAISLLGVYVPAVSDLEDLSTLIMAGPEALAATKPQEPVAAAAGAQLSVSYDTVRDRFNFAWAVEREGNDYDGDTTWWWARDVRFDPNEIIADDDSGNLWSVPFSTDGEDEITFGEPARVRETFVPLAAAASRVASFARPSKPSRPPATAASNAATERPNTEEGEDMDQGVREILVGQGLDPDTATEEQVNAASVLAAAATLNPPTEEPEAPEAPEAETANPEAEAEAETEEAPETERVPVAASRVPEGMRLIDEAELATLREGAQAGTRLAAEKAREERDRVILAARDEGRFPPARLAHYERMWDKDPEGTRTLLTADEDKGGLAKGTVPMAARAEAPDPQAAGEDGMTAADRTLLAASRERMGFKTAEVA